MQGKKDNRGIAKVLRYLLWGCLALVVVLQFTMDRAPLTRAGEDDFVEAPAPSELVVEEPAPAPEPAPEPAPAPEAPAKQETVVASDPAEVTSDAAPVESESESGEEENSAMQENAKDSENKEQTELTPAEEGEQAPAVERSVKIHSNLQDSIDLNDTFTMTAELSGFEGVTYHAQWQVDEGFGWEDVAGATGLTLELPANALSANSAWRLVVSVDE